MTGIYRLTDVARCPRAITLGFGGHLVYQIVTNLMQLVIFEDDATAQLNPLALSKPAFEITCGGYRLSELLAQLQCPMRALVRPHLQSLIAADHRFDIHNSQELLLAVNARLVPNVANLQSIRKIAEDAKPGVSRNNGAIAVAVFPKTRDLEFSNPSDFCDAIDAFQLPRFEDDFPLIEYPHDIIKRHVCEFGSNLLLRLQQGQYRQIDEGVFSSDPKMVIDDTVRFDAQCGPIVFERGVKIRPFVFLRGPAHFADNVRINEHCSIKDNVFVGANSKVGGEIEESIIEPYSNKQHHGYLGHSYVGSWVNLGAGTCNSDLKNTYGNIRCEYGDKRVDTEMQFLGCMIGDYTKTAVNTSIFTGKVIGACSALYGFVTSNVPSFANYARSFGQVTDMPPNVIIDMQRRMFARRQLEQQPRDVQLIEQMYKIACQERQLEEGPPRF